ncbi:MAG: NAD(P)-binding protein [Steroidobacteraceae bacterium]|jgi:protoporphyrinogen oxidase/glycosyltransferase involved in cell wall biosynthesis|nr:NAD(P)-binding protein [Steroidobacteraceae bacterium]
MPSALIVFSHLRWDFVFQRPQHLLTRLARRHPVYFFEEPLRVEGESRLEVVEAAPNVHVCRPHTSIDAPGFHDDQIPVLQKLVGELVEREALVDYALWFYSPMALPLAQELAPRAVAYDCMDELSAFLNAPKQLHQRESALLKAADVVFTGGPSLYRAKKDRHANVHCFPSSVDAAHFAEARMEAADHPLQARLPRPRLGFYGVIDERIDLDLLAGVADARPDWQIVMVGPVVKIDPASLPRRPNVHYYGQQPYAELPKFVAGWDLCILPFALNDSTRYISPTKTLEYMAAERPIVGTAVTDVVGPHGDLVEIVDSVESFVAACELLLGAPPEALAALRARMRARVATTSWDATAGGMADLLARAAQERSARVGEVFHPQSAPAEVAAVAAHDSHVAVMERAPRAGVPAAGPVHDAIVVGAGPTGLSCAYHLGRGSLLLDQNETIGGWCRSVMEHGFTFDHAGHIMFSTDPYVHELYRKLLGDNVHWQDREAWIYSKQVYTRYPFQGALYGLPPDVLKECIVGAIEARFGPLKPDAKPAAKAVLAVAGQSSAGAPPACAPAADLKSARSAFRGSSSPSMAKAESLTDCCGDGIAEAELPLAAASQAPRAPAGDGRPRNFEEFIYRVWGAGVAKHFAIPYNRKLWATPLHEIETSWLGGRVPLPDLEEMIDGALHPVAKPQGPNARFGYPLRGGFQALMDGFLPLLEGGLRLNARVVRVVPSRREVHLQDGSRHRYRQLVSTMPLPKLVEMIGAEAPPHVHAAVRKLRHVSVRNVNLGVGRERLTEKHWIYYPEDTVFHRIFVQGNASPHCNPPGGFGLTCEITYAPSKPLPCEGQALIDLCIRDCVQVGLIREDDPILCAIELDMPYAYVVYDHARKENFEIVKACMEAHDIVLAGRYGEWEYYNSDHAFIAGRNAATKVWDALSRRTARAGTVGAAAESMASSAGTTASG